MVDADHVRQRFASALAGASRGRDVADRLCGACVELLSVDGAALSIIYEGSISRSFGASSGLSRELDELQFTYGEGPCLEAVRDSTPVLVSDLSEPPATRWAGFADAAAQRGVHAVFAFPVSIASLPIGALDLYRNDPGELDGAALAGGLIAAELAALPILDLMGIDLNAAVADETSGAWEELTALMRVEVYQAAGMLIAQLGVSASEALVRLRGYAFSHDLTASEVAYQILDRRLRLSTDPTSSTEDDGQA